MILSAIIPTRNRPKDLLQAVETVIRQTHLPNQLLIIDQSADDISKNLIEGLFAREKPSMELNYIHDTSITGLVHAKDVGVKKSSGDIVMFLEDDVILSPTYVECLLNGFLENPKMMGSCGVMTDVSKFTWGYRLLFRLFHRGFLNDQRARIHGNPSQWGNKFIPSMYLSGGLSAFRREVFEKVPFDLKNDFFMIEDSDFSTRAERAFGDDKFFINTSARLDHYYSPVNRAVQKPRYNRKMREYVVFYKKNSYRKWSSISFAWLLVGCVLEASLESIKSRSLNPLIGMGKGLIEGSQWKVQAI